MIFLSAKARRIVEDAVQRLPDARDRQIWTTWSRRNPAVKPWNRRQAVSRLCRPRQRLSPYWRCLSSLSASKAIFSSARMMMTSWFNSTTLWLTSDQSNSPYHNRSISHRRPPAQNPLFRAPTVRTKKVSKRYPPYNGPPLPCYRCCSPAGRKRATTRMI